MSILGVCQNVSLVIGLDKPSQVFASTEREHLELGRLANACAEMIRNVHDWQALKVLKTYTGDDTSETFALPDDYDRMEAGASLWSSRWKWDFTHILSTDQWLEYQVVPYTFVNGNWIIYGGDFHVLPVMESTENVKFFYISKYAVNGTTQELFTADTDTFDLSERLLELAMIWAWKSDKGLPSEKALADYNEKLGKEVMKDGGSKPVVSGNPAPTRFRGGWAFPQTVGS